MKYLPLILLFASCNALTLLTNQTGSTAGGFNSELGDDNNSNALICPAGYAKVKGNSILGTNDFCVMKFEAKDVGGVAKSQEYLTPWTSGINLAAAKSNCLALGSGFDLISNPEWMTVAAEMESIDGNWSNGTVGSGCLFRGNTGETTAPATCGYDGLNPEFGNVASRDARAGMFLASGEIVWDLSGNVQEWVDWTVGGPADIGPTDAVATCASTDIEISSISSNNDCPTLVAADYLPQDPTLSSTQGVGKFYGGAGGAIVRGGTFLNTNTAGIYRLTTNSVPGNLVSGIGFRCVYRGSP
jgi:hypothetical protein